MTKRQNLKRISVTAAVLLVLGGCASIDDRVARESALIGPVWRLVSIEQGGTITNLSPEQSARYTIAFPVHDDARLRLDCNSGTAAWTAAVRQRALRIGNIRSTKMLCPNGEIAEAVLAGLPGGNTYTFTDDEHRLTVQSKTMTFTFTDAAH